MLQASKVIGGDFKISHHAEVFELKTSFSGNVNGLLFTKFSVQFEKSN